MIIADQEPFTNGYLAQAVRLRGNHYSTSDGYVREGQISNGHPLRQADTASVKDDLSEERICRRERRNSGYRGLIFEPEVSSQSFGDDIACPDFFPTHPSTGPK
jgi:hypothetical protein